MHGARHGLDGPRLLDGCHQGPIVGATLGCEFSGDVVWVGSAVENKRLVLGAAVFGCVYGNHAGQPDNAAFAEFVAIAGDLVSLLPGHLTEQEGATIGVSLPTVAMSVCYPWKLPFPRVEPVHQRPQLSTASNGEGRYVLIYGGSTAMGTMALQLLNLSGLVPVCTCSPRNFAMVKALGAAEAFDYRQPSCGDGIRRYTGGTLAYALDCITDLSSMHICYATLSGGGGQYMGLDPLPLRGHTRRDVKPDWTLVFTMFNKTTQCRPSLLASGAAQGQSVRQGLVQSHAAAHRHARPHQTLSRRPGF